METFIVQEKPFLMVTGWFRGSRLKGPIGYRPHQGLSCKGGFWLLQSGLSLLHRLSLGGWTAG